MIFIDISHLFPQNLEPVKEPVKDTSKNNASILHYF